MRNKAKAAIYFTSEDYHLEQKELKGRQAAGNFFLRGLVEHTSFPEVSALGQASLEPAWKRALGPLANTRPVNWVSPHDIAALSRVGCVYFPAPNFEEFANMRLYYHPRAYSICGITHTTASCLELFASLPAMPLFSWDGIICTSSAVRDTLRKVLEDASEYYAWRFGSGRAPLPQLPMIPLGIVADDYVVADGSRVSARNALAIGEDEAAVLFLGRLSFHAKANPASMFLALEETARTTGKRVTIALCGWFINKGQEDAFVEGAKVLAPSVRMIILDGRDELQRKQAWAAADIFCSLSDNIQETFGLTPLEAMAAGLPVVISDWDGYRDTVRDGIDGFRIRTLTPAPPWGREMAMGFAAGLINYDHYLMRASQVTTVDIDDCVKALTELIRSPELRRKMGEAGQKRAREVFDWSNIIPQYEEFWGDLAERRRADAEPLAGKAPQNMPGYPDPFYAFSTYPTELLSEGHVIAVRGENPRQLFAERTKLSLYQHGSVLGLPTGHILTMLEHLQQNGPATVEALAGSLAPNLRGRMMFSLLWCAKMGIVRIDQPRRE